MRVFFAGSALAFALAACGQAEHQSAGRDAPAEMVAPAGGETAAGGPDFDRAQHIVSQDEAADAAAPAQSQAHGPAPVLYLAYSYQVSIELPAQRFETVMDAHVAACQSAGPRLCQLIGASRSGDPESYMSGHVSLRGEPDWLRGFMAGLARAAEEAGGRIKSQSTATEDLTRSIVDSEAHMRAKTALRDRLQRLLATRPGKLEELLAAERALADVQGELDAVRSSLEVMRTRVAMSELTLSYETSPRTLRADTFEPLGRASANFLGLVVQGVANIVTVVAVMLPWLAVLGAAAWGVLALRKARGGRLIGPVRTPAAAQPPPAPPPPP